MAGHLGSKLPSESMMGWVEGAVVAGVKALRPLRGGLLAGLDPGSAGP
jgi:hypothetical protein